MVKTPECDKMLKVQDESQAIGAFLDWLQSERRLTLCEANDRTFENSFIPARIGIEDLLAEYFKIDLNKVEKERRAILEECRKQQKAV